MSFHVQSNSSDFIITNNVDRSHNVYRMLHAFFFFFVAKFIVVHVLAFVTSVSM